MDLYDIDLDKIPKEVIERDLDRYPKEYVLEITNGLIAEFLQRRKHFKPDESEYIEETRKLNFAKKILEFIEKR